MSYTPGPWNLHRHYSGERLAVKAEDGSEMFAYWRLYVGPGDGIVAQIDGDTTGTGWWNPDNGEEVMANAKLIAAAPELVEALKELCQMDWRAEDNPDTWAKARAALEKAGVEL